MSEVIVIQSDLRKTEKQRLRVGAYARVSSNSLEQEDSFHNQVRYYTKYITSNPEGEFVDIYADEGITGTRQDKRDDFNRVYGYGQDNEKNIYIVPEQAAAVKVIFTRFQRGLQYERNCRLPYRRKNTLPIGKTCMEN